MRPVVMYVLTSHSRMFARVSVFVSSASHLWPRECPQVYYYCNVSRYFEEFRRITDVSKNSFHMLS